MSATFKRAAAFLIALCLTVGMFGQLVFADDYVETEEPAAEEVLEIAAESEDEELADIQLEEPESEEAEPSAEAAVESESSEDVEETAEPASEAEETVSVSEDETTETTESVAEEAEDISESAVEETEAQETASEDAEVTENRIELLGDEYEDGGDVSEGSYTYSVGEGEYWKVKYVPSKSGILTVYSSANMDTYGYLYDSDMYFLVSDDDSGNGNNFLYTYSVEADTTYYIVFRFYSSNNSGSIPINISLTELKEGWNQSGSGDWFYVKDGELLKGWQKIDGYWYYFDGNGRMYANTTFSVWNSTKGITEYYRADASGHMVTGWYQDGSRWYYYYSSGAAAQGLTTIGSKQYYFSYDGYMNTNTTYYDSDNKKIIVVGSDGVVTSTVAVKNGWIKAGDDWYYFENDSPVNGWKKIGGYWYYFAWNGRMYADTAFSVWNSDTGIYEYFRVDASGHMITGWYQDGIYWYYYYGSGVAARGVQTVNGAKYYFDNNGRMNTNGTYNTGTSIIKVDSAGHVTNEISADSDGWKSMGSDWYYVYQGSFVSGRLMDIDGYTYYFDYNGIMFANGIAYASGYHGFDKSGHMVKGGWFECLTDNGGWYYFDTNGNALTGLQNVGGVNYYFEYNGKMAVSRKFIEGDKLYVIDASGKVTVYSGASGWVANYYYVENGALVENGWKSIGGYWYYFDNGISRRNGYSWINGICYYFDSSGAMKTGWIKYGTSWLYADGSGALKENTWYQYGGTWYYFDGVQTVSDIVTIDGKTYLFNSDSTYVGDVTGTNKWVENDKYWYYLKADGSYAQEESVTISGSEYYFSYNGRMVTDTTIWSGGSSKYYGANGKAVVSGWAETGEKWRYYDASGTYVESAWKKIGSSWYYFDGSGYMVFGDKIIDNKLYHFSNSGVWDGKSGTALTKGWNLVSGNYYYYDGSSFYTGIHNIGGTNYCFYYDGRMVHDTRYNSCIWTSSGAQLKGGWFKDQYDQWYYADASGIPAEGLQTIGGKKYYFIDGRMITYGRTADNVYYDIGSDGVVKKTVTASGTKWTQVSDGWVYCKDGIFLSGMHKVDGSYYYFNAGKMLTNFMSYSTGYFGSDGKLVKSEGWVKNSSGYWYYLINGEPLYGSWYIDGKWYYLNSYADDGIYFVDGAFYKYAGSSGGRTKLSFSEGWNKYNGSWYYVEDSYLVKGAVRKIDSKYYFFDYDGKMTSGDLAVYYYGVKYLQSNGTFLKNGWKKIDGTWYYFGPDGNALTGTWTIDGTTYHLTTPNYYGGGIGGIA